MRKQNLIDPNLGFSIFQLNGHIQSRQLLRRWNGAPNFAPEPLSHGKELTRRTTAISPENNDGFRRYKYRE